MATNAATGAALFNLRARWALFLLIGLLVIFGSSSLLNAAWPAAAAQAWVVLAAGVFFAQLLILWFDLPKNVSVTSGKLLPHFGPGTWLSLARVLALSMLAGFLWPPRPAGWLAWLPFTLYFLYCLADLADGYAARVSGVVTTLGQKLDLDLDGRGLLVATLLAVHYGLAGWWFLLVGLARYAFLLAAWLHKQLGGTFKLHPNSLRRPLAGAQMGIGVALLAPQLPTGLTFFVSTLSMFPFVGNFLFDWLVAAGWLRFKKSSRRWKAWLALSGWGLLATRVALTALLILRVWGEQANLYFFLDVILGLILLFGLAGRTAAFALLIGTGFRLQGQTVQTLDFAILFVGMILLYLGTGAFSWRQLKEGWIFRRWGAKRPA
jgi:CDP-diacylglycerol--glycerol-3-phosphate 3-phosphatidyltransferase